MWCVEVGGGGVVEVMWLGREGFVELMWLGFVEMM